MNSVLHLKGQFEYQSNPNKPGPKNLPMRAEVKVEHLKNLKEQVSQQ